MWLSLPPRRSLLPRRDAQKSTTKSPTTATLAQRHAIAISLQSQDSLHLSVRIGEIWCATNWLPSAVMCPPDG
jgi:hypothetical protein